MSEPRLELEVEKDNELTGPYKTLSVVGRTKVLGISDQLPGEKRKPPPLPSQQRPPVSPRVLHPSHDGGAKAVNGSGPPTPRGKPPPVVPFSKHKESKKVYAEHSTFLNQGPPPSHNPRPLSQPAPSSNTNPLPSPTARNFSHSPSPPAFEIVASSHSPIPYQVPTVAKLSSVSSYEEPVISERPPMGLPNSAPPKLDSVPVLERSDTATLGGIYSEVDKDVVIGIIASAKSDDPAYEMTSHNRSDPDVAPMPPVGNDSYELLATNTGDSVVTSSTAEPAGYEEVGLVAAAKPKSKRNKPPLPSKPPGVSKQLQLELSNSASPPKPKRTYRHNPKTDSSGSSVDEEEKKRSKPVPLPRGTRSSYEDDSHPVSSLVSVDSVDSRASNAASLGDSQQSQQDTTTASQPPQLRPVYSYVGIVVPDSPTNAPHMTPTVTAVSDSTNKPEAEKPKRRPPPPPPPPASSKPRMKSNSPKGTPPPKGTPLPPTSKSKKNSVPSNSNSTAATTFPSPTPAQPVQKSKFNIKSMLGFKKTAAAQQDAPGNTASCATNAGKTPPKAKRSGSIKKIFTKDKSAGNQKQAQSKPQDSAVVFPDDILDDITGYAAVGPGSQVVGAQPKPSKGVSKQKTPEVDLKSDMTPRTQQKVLACYAEVDLSKKVSRRKERPLSNSYSEENLSPTFPAENSRGVSLFGTLPRQRRTTGNKDKPTTMPVYSIPFKPKKRTKSAGTFDDGKENEVGIPMVEPSPSSLPTFDDPRPMTPPHTNDALVLAPSSPSPHNPDPVAVPPLSLPASRSKEEIATKTASLGRTPLKRKSKPAPPPPPGKAKPSKAKTLDPRHTSYTDKGAAPTVIDSMYCLVGPPAADKKVSSKPAISGMYATVGPPSDEGGKLALPTISPPPNNSMSNMYESLDCLDGAGELPSLQLAAEGSGELLPRSTEGDSKPPNGEDGRRLVLVKKESSLQLPSEDSDDEDVTDDSFSDDDDDEQEEKAGPTRSNTYNVAKELLTTERTFVKGLTLLDKDFRQAVISQNRAHDRPILAEDILNMILSNVGSLCILNGGLLTQLEDRLAKWDFNPKIGDIFVKTAPFLKLYTEYISNFDKALRFLDDACKKNRPFGELVREFEGRPVCANLPLSGYLLETVQRIPRYKLLLQDYLKYLPKDSEDRSDSEKALELISEVAKHVNQSIRQVDNFKKLIDVQKKLTGDVGDSLISPSRKLLREGELLKYSRKEIQPRMFFLFTDILIYAYAVPPANVTYKVVKRIPLQGMKVSELDDPGVKHGLQIISTCKSFRLGTTTEEDKKQWKKALDNALFEHESMLQSRERYRAMSISAGKALDDDAPVAQGPLGSLAPPWLPDNCVSMCMMCTDRFNLTKRRHHCRACGNIFCAPCSSYLATLKYQDYKMDRVCQTCYDQLTKGDKSVSGKKLTGHVQREKTHKPAVLTVKARGRSCEISGYMQLKDIREKKLKKQWLEVAEFALFVYEKHEDASAKRSVSLPGYMVIYPLPDIEDRSQLCLTHPGTGPLYFKADSEEVAEKWVEVFQNAVKLKSIND